MAGNEYAPKCKVASSSLENEALDEAGEFAPVVQAMAKDGENYDGTAHLNLIESLVDSGDYQLAWNASLRAGFWICKSRSAVPNK